jgi:hypothetical protein
MPTYARRLNVQLATQTTFKALRRISPCPWRIGAVLFDTAEEFAAVFDSLRLP